MLPLSSPRILQSYQQLKLYLNNQEPLRSQRINTDSCKIFDLSYLVHLLKDAFEKQVFLK